MTVLKVAVCLAVVGCIRTPAPAVAQATSCLAQPDSVKAYLRGVRTAFRFTDSASTRALGNPWARPDSITHVTSEAVCQAAVTAFNSIAVGPPGVQGETAFYVFAIGTTGYVLMRPGDTSSGRRHMFIFTNTWVYKATLL